MQAYALEAADPALELAEVAIRAAGLEPAHVATGGASDAHQFIANGLPSACLGVGYVNVHSDDEYMPLGRPRKPDGGGDPAHPRRLSVPGTSSAAPRIVILSRRRRIASALATHPAPSPGGRGLG